MNQDNKARALGRGLSSLLGPELANDTDSINQIINIDIHEVCPGKYQPRQYFDVDQLDSLVLSIQQKGIIQPILVRPIQQGLANYEIIAGERRWQAAKKALLKEIPVIIRQMSDTEALETALIENIQRHDLSALEEAEGYQRLIDEFHYTQEDLAKFLGKSRSHIANQLRILGLPESVKQYVESGQMSAGHAKAIASSDNIEEIAHMIVKQGLSVRQAESMTKKISTRNNYNNDNSRNLNPDIQSIQQMLVDTLQLNVSLIMTIKEQKLCINFKTMEDLERIIAKLTI